jgi:hypothetical protein
MNEGDFLRQRTPMVEMDVMSTLDRLGDKVDAQEVRDALRIDQNMIHVLVSLGNQKSALEGAVKQLHREWDDLEIALTHLSNKGAHSSGHPMFKTYLELCALRDKLWQAFKNAQKAMNSGFFNDLQTAIKELE